MPTRNDRSALFAVNLHNKGPLIIYRRGGGWVILGGDLKFWPVKKAGPGVIAELWRGGGLEILKKSVFKMEKLTLCIWCYLKHY